MSMLDETTVRQAFRTKLLTVSGLPDEKQISYENRLFDPPDQPAEVGDKTLWVLEQMRILSESRSSDSLVEAIGEFLWLVYTPKGKGTEKADTLSRSIAEAFQAGQSLTKDGIGVILERTERRPYRGDANRPAWVFKTVATTWRVFTQA